MPRNNKIRPRNHKPPKKQESFWAGLISLMAKQCIASAMIFGALYFMKNSNLPFLGSAFAFIKTALSSHIAPTILSFLS